MKFLLSLTCALAAFAALVNGKHLRTRRFVSPSRADFQVAEASFTSKYVENTPAEFKDMVKEHSDELVSH